MLEWNWVYRLRADEILNGPSSVIAVHLQINFKRSQRWYIERLRRDRTVDGSNSSGKENLKY